MAELNAFAKRAVKRAWSGIGFNRTTLMLSLPIAAGFAAAIVSTSFISGIFGMAGGMILMGILLGFMPLAPAMVLHGLVQIGSNGWRAWQWRSHIDWRIVAHYAAGAVVAAAAVGVMALVASKAIALIIVGVSPLLGLLLPGRLTPDIERPSHAHGCGVLCTVLQLLAGVPALSWTCSSCARSSTAGNWSPPRPPCK